MPWPPTGHKVDAATDGLAKMRSVSMILRAEMRSDLDRLGSALLGTAWTARVCSRCALSLRVSTDGRVDWFKRRRSESLLNQSRCVVAAEPPKLSAGR